MTDKEVVRNLLERLPESAALDDITEEITILQRTRYAEAEIAAGRTIPHEEVARRMEKWISQ